MSAGKAMVAAAAVAIFLMGAALATGAAFEDTANEHRVENESFVVNQSKVPYNVTLNESERPDTLYDTDQLQDPVVENQDTNTTMSSPDDYRWNANGTGKLWIPSGSDLANGNTTNATADYSYGTWTANEEQLYDIAQAGAQLAPAAILALALLAVLIAVGRL